MLGKWFHRPAEPAVDVVDLIASRRYLARITVPGDTRPPTRGDRAERRGGNGGRWTLR